MRPSNYGAANKNHLGYSVTMHSSLRQIWIAISCLMATIAMILPSSDGLFYCFPMQRIMIEDCCGEDETHSEQAILTHPQCCEKLDTMDVDTPPTVDAPNIVQSHWLVSLTPPKPLVFEDSIRPVERAILRARGPPHRGPPPPKTSIFIQNQSLLI